jgi:hypothetical protein
MNLNQLRAISREVWTFDEKDYPLLARLSLPEDRQAFTLRHVLSHITKTVGQIAVASESLDHGQNLNINKLRTSLGQLILEVVQCADVVGITPDDLEYEIRTWKATRERKEAI